MTTPELITRNIKEILTVFDRYHLLTENKNILKGASKENTKDYFKIAYFVEKAVADCNSKNCTDLFLETLRSWNASNGRTKIYSISVYSRACDHLLAGFFKCKSLRPSVVDVAVRMYTALLPRDRLENMLSALITTSLSCKTIADYAVQNKSIINCKELEARLLLNSWSEKLQIAETDHVKELITSMLSNYKVESSLAVLIKMLATRNACASENNVKDLIADCIVKKMMDRSILSKAFWLALFSAVEQTDIAEACQAHHDFFVQLSNFIVYVGSMMNNTTSNGRNMWVGDPNISICPEITYSSLLEITRCLYYYAESHKLFLDFTLTQAEQNTGSLLWEQFILELKE